MAAKFMKKKIDLAKGILEAQERLDDDKCDYPEDHYGCYIREMRSLVEKAEEVVKQK
jgi:hypothetical protein